MTIRVERFAYQLLGTFGELTVPGKFRAFTVEKPWANNAPQLSCIPLGTYRIRLGIYQRGNYPAFELLDVPGRSLIKMHIANLPEDVLGCIGIGGELGYLKNQWAVLRSYDAFERFMKAMKGVQEDYLVISNRTQQMGGIVA